MTQAGVLAREGATTVEHMMIEESEAPGEGNDQHAEKVQNDLALLD